MKSEILLHIGTNKTGTTAIQYFFEQNQELLMKKGLLYPRTGRVGHAHYLISRLLGFGNQAGIDRSRQKELAAEARDHLIAEIERERAKKILISSEEFVRPRRLQPLKSFFRGFDVKVVIYLRRHDAWYESAYVQDLIMNKSKPWKNGIVGFIQHQKKHFGSHTHRWLVDRWAEMYGKENIIVRPYETRQNQPDLITDFLSYTGLSAYAADITDRFIVANRSPSAFGIRIMEMVRYLKLPKKYIDKLYMFVNELPRPVGKSYMLTYKDRQQLIEENMDDYNYIAREYLGRPDGKLFYEPLSEADG